MNTAYQSNMVEEINLLTFHLCFKKKLFRNLYSNYLHIYGYIRYILCHGYQLLERNALYTVLT